jgi:hypothetical protein
MGDLRAYTYLQERNRLRDARPLTPSPRREKE